VTQNQNASVSITSPTGSQTVAHGQSLPINWFINNAPTSGAAVVDLYTAQGNKIGTIAISSNMSGGFNWTIPTPNTICTQQYPNALCGQSLSGQYYIKVSLVAGNGFDSNSTTYASATSGVFTIY
jgi:hypothetical protein